MHQRTSGLAIYSILIGSSVLPILCYPSLPDLSHQLHTEHVRQSYQQQVQPQQLQPQQLQPQKLQPLKPQHHQAESRKFAEKPNATKKVQSSLVLEDRNDLDDVQTNQIQDSSASAGFSWSNVLGMVMNMLFNPNQASGPSKSDSTDVDQQGLSQSPWTNLISVGLKIISAFLGGNPIAGGDGIDKVDNASPMQGILSAVLSTVLGSRDPEQVATMAKQAGEFINIVVNLLDALKTSFSHRSSAARSLGKKDSVSDAAIAGITLFKGYVRTMRTSDDNCMQKYVCDANRECADDLAGANAIYCQLGTYATSLALQQTSSSPFDSFYEAGRKGRSGEECQKIYSACSES